MVNCVGTMGKAVLGEWFWRFLAAVMLFAVGWTIWIFAQLNPPQLIMPAAFEAAAKAKVDPQQSAQGVIVPAAGTDPAKDAAKEAPKEAPKEPPVNAEKLKFSDSLSSPEIVTGTTPAKQ
jgi:hypothetical protein